VTELSDLLAAPSDGVTTRTARVIAVKGRVLTVDIGGGIDIPCVDSCNPQPDQVVTILSNGTSMLAVGAMNGTYRQAAVTVQGIATTYVQGLLNGTLRSITKMGSFTPTVGDTLPLIWSADGSGVWAGPPPGAAYVPPPAGGGASGGGGGITSGTASYPATWAGIYTDHWVSGGVLVSANGSYFYGSGRFRELQGRTITGFRAYLPKVIGSASYSVFGHSLAGPSGGAPAHGYSAGSASASGWVALPIGLAGYLIAGSGTGGLTFSGSGVTLQGLPAGTLQFDWRR
jgi:hypothetical protein